MPPQEYIWNAFHSQPGITQIISFFFCFTCLVVHCFCWKFWCGLLQSFHSQPDQLHFFSLLKRSGCNIFFHVVFRHKTEYQKKVRFIPFLTLTICTLQWSDKEPKNRGRETVAENNLAVFRKWRMVPIGIGTPLNGFPSFHSLAQFLSKKRGSGYPRRWWKRKPSKMPVMPPR